MKRTVLADIDGQQREVEIDISWGEVAFLGRWRRSQQMWGRTRQGQPVLLGTVTARTALTLAVGRLVADAVVEASLTDPVARADHDDPTS